MQKYYKISITTNIRDKNLEISFIPRIFVE